MLADCQMPAFSGQSMPYTALVRLALIHDIMVSPSETPTLCGEFFGQEGMLRIAEED